MNSEFIIPAIDAVELLLISMPLVRPFATSFSVQDDKQALLVKIGSRGESGWGECVASPDPYYSPETNFTAYSVLKHFLVPLLAGSHRGCPLEEILARFERVRGHRMAKAALENALLDLLAKTFDQPLWQLLGGRERLIPSGISIGIQPSIGTLINAVSQAVARKYQRIKIKIKRGHDVEPLRQIRERFPEIPLLVDANADYSLADVAVFKALDELRLMMIEQPLAHDDLLDHSRLQAQLKTPICLDESIETSADAELAIRLKSCRIINIKQGRVGGLLASRRIQDLCRQNGIAVWSGGMLESGIGRAVNIHLQTLSGFTLPGDTSETNRYFREDIVEPPVVLDQDGFIAIPAGPGIGVQVVENRLKRRTQFRETLL